jgi:hypothetical protein
MRDLWIHGNDLIVATHGRAFWILDDIAPLRETSAALANAVHLFKPAPAYRVQRDTNTDTPLPPDEPAAANPPDGAIIDYYLPAAASSASIEIQDAQGHVVRTFTNADKPEATDEELQKQQIPLYWIRPFRLLSTDAGMHRWVWDLHYPASIVMGHEFPIAAIPHDTPRGPLGPTAMPGIYTVTLTVDGKTSTAPLTVKMDPRVKIPAAGLQKKFTVEKALASSLTATSQALLQGASIREQLGKLSAQPNPPNKDAVEAFEKKLNELLGAAGGFFAPPSQDVTMARVNGQAAALYAQIWQADAEPTSSQMEALAATERDKDAILKRWAEFKGSELAKLNGALREVNAPEIKPQADFQHEETQVDEE